MYIRDDPYASYKLLAAEFEKRGYTVTKDIANAKVMVSYKSPAGASWRTRAAKIGYPFITEKIKDISINKDRAYDFAKDMGVSIPYTKLIPKDYSPSDSEIDNLISSHRRLIVKPSGSSLARGLTLDVNSPVALRQAIDYARRVNPAVLVQEQVEGEEIRFAVIDGKVVSALLRRTPRVIGDGVSTVARLLELENDERRRINLAYVKYPILSGSLIDKAWFDSDEILGQGVVLELNRATMVKNGCSIYDVLTDVHPSYIKVVEKMVQTLGAKFIVVDVFFSDFKSEKTDHNYWFIEFNTSPVLKLFYACRDGKTFDIVPRLVDTVDGWLHRSER